MNSSTNYLDVFDPRCSSSSSLLNELNVPFIPHLYFTLCTHREIGLLISALFFIDSHLCLFLKSDRSLESTFFSTVNVLNYSKHSLSNTHQINICCNSILYLTNLIHSDIPATPVCIFDTVGYMKKKKKEISGFLQGSSFNLYLSFSLTAAHKTLCPSEGLLP